MPEGNVLGLIASAASIVRETVAEVVFETESVTVTTMLNVPDVVGVPPTTPEAESVRPAGIDDPLAGAHVQLYPVPEPPVAVSVAPG